MYAHLIRHSSAPVSTVGYRARYRCRYTYGSLETEAELRFPELSNEGLLEFSIYSADKRAMLMHGQLPGRSRAAGERYSESELLEIIMPRADVSYLLSLFGIRRGGYSFDDLHRARIELPDGRRYKWYERHELRITQGVDLPWLQLYGSVFGQNG